MVVSHIVTKAIIKSTIGIRAIINIKISLSNISY